MLSLLYKQITTYTSMKKVTMLFMVLGVVLLASCNRQSNKQTITNLETENKMKPIELTKADFLSKVMDYEKNADEWKYLGNKPAIVDFYADWCGPCKTIAPILEELAEEYKDDIYIYKINTEQEEELAAVFNIRSIPTLLFIPMAGQPQLAQGALPKATFKEAIETVLLKR